MSPFPVKARQQQHSNLYIYIHTYLLHTAFKFDCDF